MTRLALLSLAGAVFVMGVALPGSGRVLTTESGDRSASTGKIPIPAQTLRQIIAEYGQATFVPAFAPRGFIFTSWRTEVAERLNYYRLVLTFGRYGTLLRWTVSDGHDKDDYADCSKQPSSQFRQSISGRVVHYRRGIHGDVAWTCFRARSRHGGTWPVGIDLWIANDVGRPSRLTAMRMVASARRP